MPDAAKKVDPAAQRFRATAQNEQANCLSANGPRQGRSTIESDVQRVAGRFWFLNLNHLAKDILNPYRAGVSGLPMK